MDRRKSLKVMALSAVSSALLLDACKPKDKKIVEPVAPNSLTIDRAPEEVAEHKRLTSETFFTPHEMATIGVLSDIIIPADEVSGSATEAKVPDFIEFIVKDKPEHQTPMRGGLRWMDLQCNKLFGKPFTECSREQQLQLVDAIAYPKKAAARYEAGCFIF